MPMETTQGLGGCEGGYVETWHEGNAGQGCRPATSPPAHGRTGEAWERRGESSRAARLQPGFHPNGDHPIRSPDLARASARKAPCLCGRIMNSAAFKLLSAVGAFPSASLPVLSSFSSAWHRAFTGACACGQPAWAEEASSSNRCHRGRQRTHGRQRTSMHSQAHAGHGAEGSPHLAGRSLHTATSGTDLAELHARPHLTHTAGPQLHMTQAAPPLHQPSTGAAPTQQAQQPAPAASSAAPASPPILKVVPIATGFKKTFYKRHLPSPPAIAFACTEGRQLFQEALAAGTMAGFFKLMEQFRCSGLWAPDGGYQDQSAGCGSGVLMGGGAWCGAAAL